MSVNSILAIENISSSYITYGLTLLLLIIFIILVNKSFKKANTERVEGLWFGTLDMIFETVENFVGAFVGKDRASRFVPLFFVTYFLILIGNSLSIFQFTEIALDLSIPFTLTIMMFFYWNYVVIRENGFGNFIKGFFQPIPFLFPIEVLGFLSKPLSLMIRMFGNILSGYIIMLLLWNVNTALFELASFVTVSGIFSGVGAILLVAIIGVLQIYFSLFSSFIQATVFTSLSMANIGTAFEE